MGNTPISVTPRPIERVAPPKYYIDSIPQILCNYDLVSGTKTHSRWLDSPNFPTVEWRTRANQLDSEIQQLTTTHVFPRDLFAIATRLAQLRKERDEMAHEFYRACTSN